MNWIRLPEPGDAHDDQQGAGHQARGEQTRDAVLARDRREDDDEGGGGTGDLELAAAEHRDDRAGDDGGVEPVLGRNADRDRQRHRQRQRDDADHDAREQIGAQLGAP